MREPSRLSHERVAVQQHEGRLPEALDQRLQVGRVGSREVQVGVAEAAVHLDGQRVSGRLVRVERRDDVLRHAVEPAAVGGNRLQRNEAVGAGARDVLGGIGASRLDPQDGSGSSVGQLAEALPLDSRPGRREAVVDEQPVGSRRPQERGRVLLDLRLVRCANTDSSVGSRSKNAASSRIARR